MSRQSSHSKSTNRLTISCDDFGLDPQTNAAILELAREGKIHATSVLMTHVKENELRKLSEVKKEFPSFHINLHFNLTEGNLLTLHENFSPTGIFLKLLFLRESASLFREEFRAQVKKFRQHLGEPDGVDGHQHIQYLPFLYPKIKGWIQELNLKNTPLKDARFLTVDNTKLYLKIWTINFFSYWHQGTGESIDLAHLLHSFDNINFSEQCSIMAHVAKPVSNLEMNKVVDFGSYSFDSRYRQYQFIKNLKV